jgi:hypothetical protein
LSNEPEVSEKELEELYVPYTHQKLSTLPLSKAVFYLGFFTGFGEIWAQRHIWGWKRNPTPKAKWPKGTLRSQAFQERALDAALADLKDCVVLSTTPTYFSQYQNACLLKSRGFELVAGSCYLHPGMSAPREGGLHPGTPDGHEHYEHVWWKVQGHPKEIGSPPLNSKPSLANCGVDGVVGLEGLQMHDAGERRGYLGVAWMPRGVAFPNGWKRFYSAEDYKLGHNFEAGGLLRRNLSTAQKCPHNFDLKIFEDWKPDFDKGHIS